MTCTKAPTPRGVVLCMRPRRTFCAQPAAPTAEKTVAPAATSRVPAFLGGVLLGTVGGCYLGYSYRKWLHGFNYKRTMGARLHTSHDVMTELRQDEMIKNAFSSSDIKGLYASLPRDDISFWEFKNALQRLQNEKIRFKGVLGVGQGKTGKEKLSLQRHHEISDEEALRIFRMFDTENDGKIQAGEFVTVLAIHCSGTPEQKAELLFRMWDTDGDGVITKDEMKFKYRKMPVHYVKCRALTTIMFSIAKGEHKDQITLEEFTKRPRIMRALTNMLTSSHYEKFLDKENFPAMADLVAEAVNNNEKVSPAARDAIQKREKKIREQKAAAARKLKEEQANK